MSQLKNRIANLIQNPNYLWVYLILTLFVLILPYSGLSKTYINAPNGDQSKFVEALDTTINGKTSNWVSNGTIGVGYIALGRMTAKLTSTDSANSLILLNRISIVVTFLFFYSIVKGTFDGQADKKHEFIRRASALIYTIIVIVSTSFIPFSDIPWTHFIACALALGVFWSVMKYRSPSSGITNNKKLLYSGLIGGLLGTLVQVRFFEGIIAILALTIVTVGAGIIYVVQEKDIKGLLANIPLLIVGLFIFLATWYLLGFLGRDTNLHFLYFDKVGKDQGTTELTKFYLGDTPIKIIQLFLDPNFFSFNQDYQITSLYGSITSTRWRMPILLQAPILIYAIPVACIIIPALVLFRRSRLKQLVDAEYAMLILYGIGIIISYSSVAAAGSAHLKYGFIRDYMSAILAFALAASPWMVIKITTKNWHINSPSKLFQLAALCFLFPFLISVLIGQTFAQKNYLSILNNWHITSYNTEIFCKQTECQVNIIAEGQNNQKIQSLLPERYIAYFECDKKSLNFVQTVQMDSQTTPNLRLPQCFGDLWVHLQPVIGGFSSTPEMPITFSITRAITSTESRKLQGFIDQANCYTIEGWVYDANYPYESVPVTVTLNSEPIQTLVANIERNDLALKGIGNGKHGFRINKIPPIAGNVALEIGNESWPVGWLKCDLVK